MKENLLQTFCLQELQDGTGIDQFRSAWLLLHIKVELSPFLHYYSCTETTLSCNCRSIEVESNDDNPLESLDALRPGRRT